MTVQKEVFDVPGEPGVVRVQYEVKEKAPAKVGRIYVVGNDVTQERVILRLLGIYPGQTLRYPELRIAEANLARSNIFEMKQEDGIKPTVKVLNPDADTEYKDILVELKETHTGSLMFGAGVNSSSGVMGSIVLNERNFDIFRLPTSWADITEGRAFRGAGKSFALKRCRAPRCSAIPSASVSPGYSISRTACPTASTTTSASTRKTRKLAWAAASPLPISWIAIGASAPAFASKRSASASWPTTLRPLTPRCKDKNLVVGPNVGITFDARNSFMRPTEGGMVSLTAEEDFGSFTYPLINLTASAFFTTFQRTDGSGKQVLAMKTQVGYAGADTPVYDRFFAGGYNSLRGFQFRGVGPQAGGYEVGGDFMWLNSFEYQVPMKADDTLWAVAFCDSGTVESSLEIRNSTVQK